MFLCMYVRLQSPRSLRSVSQYCILCEIISVSSPLYLFCALESFEAANAFLLSTGRLTFFFPSTQSILHSLSSPFQLVSTYWNIYCGIALHLFNVFFCKLRNVDCFGFVLTLDDCFGFTKLKRPTLRMDRVLLGMQMEFQLIPTLRMDRVLLGMQMEFQLTLHGDVCCDLWKDCSIPALFLIEEIFSRRAHSTSC